MKAVVCEDEEALQLFLEKQVCECMKEAGINGSCEVFSSAEELLEKGNPFYDLYLLDIQLGQMTGMELAEKIREKDDHAVILFATNYKEMIRKAFQVSALDYLVKPLDGNAERDEKQGHPEKNGRAAPTSESAKGKKEETERTFRWNEAAGAVAAGIAE